MKTPRCWDCGKPAADTCPLCGLSFCRVCAEREGDSCCDKAAGLPIVARARAEGHTAGVAYANAEHAACCAERVKEAEAKGFAAGRDAAAAFVASEPTRPMGANMHWRLRNNASDLAAAIRALEGK